MHYNFSQDLDDGDEGEKRVMDMLSSKCDGIVSSEHNNDNRYDWRIGLDNGMDVTVEVKHDLMIGDTGNFAFETKCRGKASGVNVTVADLFVVYCHERGEEHAYCFRTEWLKKMLATWDLQTVLGGDIDRYGNHVVEMVLVPKRMVRGCCNDIAGMEKVDLRRFSMKK